MNNRWLIAYEKQMGGHEFPGKQQPSPGKTGGVEGVSDFQETSAVSDIIISLPLPFFHILSHSHDRQHFWL